MPMRYKPEPLPPAKGLEGEDNYQILVFDREGGDFLGVALRTSLNGVVHSAMKTAAARYPGCHLVETNGPYILRAMTTPTGSPDEFGLISGNDTPLEHLPQWYGLIATCECGNMAHLDRYCPRVMKWKGYPLSTIAEKLTCTECKRAKRQQPKMTIGLYKLPR